MRSCITTTNAGPARLLALLLVCALLAACGGPEPTPVYLVVTRAPATPTGAPPTLAPEPAPTRDEVAFEAYEHPSGAFRLDLPEGAAVAADEEGISISVDGSKLLVRFTVPPEPLAGDGLKAAIPALVDTVLVEGGLIASYSDSRSRATRPATRPAAGWPSSRTSSAKGRPRPCCGRWSTSSTR